MFVLNITLEFILYLMRRQKSKLKQQKKHLSFLIVNLDPNNSYQF